MNAWGDGGCSGMASGVAGMFIGEAEDGELKVERSRPLQEDAAVRRSVARRVLQGGLTPARVHVSGVCVRVWVGGVVHVAVVELWHGEEFFSSYVGYVSGWVCDGRCVPGGVAWRYESEGGALLWSSVASPLPADAPSVVALVVAGLEECVGGPGS